MKKKAYIICHFNGQRGGLPTLEKYLEDHYELKTLLHPLEKYNEIDTNLYRNGRCVKTYARKDQGILNYVLDFYISLKNIRKDNIDVFVGCSNFDTLPAIFARIALRKRIGRIIYYPRDYSENRFSNNILNKVYETFERICVKNADLTISNTKRAEYKRVDLGLDRSKSIVIANPIMLEKPEFRHKRIDKKQFIYVGDVSEEHGLYDLVQTLKDEIDKLVIIGAGALQISPAPIITSLSISSFRV